MHIASVLRQTGSRCSAAALVGVPLVACLVLGSELLPETQASSGDPAAIALSTPEVDRPASADSGERVDPSVTLLDAWFYTDHDCSQGRSRGKGHDKQKEKSPKGCPPQRGHGR
jgi:hypothetical protein